MSGVAIVTGASRGIGRACAEALAAAGFRLYLVADGTEQELTEVTHACAAAHPQNAESRWGIFDLADAAVPERIAAAALAAFGRIDVLVNNAGIRSRKPFGTYAAAEFDQVIAVNLRAAFLLSQAVLPAMRAQKGGRIIHMASQLGMVADPGAAVYGMTKAALIQLTRSMALELAAENILVNAVSPGPIATDYFMQRLRSQPEELQRRLRDIPAGRLGTPEEIASAVVFLATTDAAFLQGHNLVVDGGYVAH
jgi:NAD(P)-dependent dehydrogenase (short-subunit alcohol dehydrogenase family)